MKDKILVCAAITSAIVAAAGFGYGAGYDSGYAAHRERALNTRAIIEMHIDKKTGARYFVRKVR